MLSGMASFCSKTNYIMIDGFWVSLMNYIAYFKAIPSVLQVWIQLLHNIQMATYFLVSFSLVNLETSNTDQCVEVAVTSWMRWQRPFGWGCRSHLDEVAEAIWLMLLRPVVWGCRGLFFEVAEACREASTEWYFNLLFPTTFRNLRSWSFKQLLKPQIKFLW